MPVPLPTDSGLDCPLWYTFLITYTWILYIQTAHVVLCVTYSIYECEFCTLLRFLPSARRFHSQFARTRCRHRSCSAPLLGDCCLRLSRLLEEYCCAQYISFDTSPVNQQDTLRQESQVTEPTRDRTAENNDSHRRYQDDCPALLRQPVGHTTHVRRNAGSAENAGHSLHWGILHSKMAIIRKTRVIIENFI